MLTTNKIKNTFKEARNGQDTAWKDILGKYSVNPLLTNLPH